jgi:predicted Zn-dependent peptidase
VPPEVVEEAALRELEAVRRGGITPAELEKARHQLRARLVFEADSVTNIAHQLGYFHTIADVDLYHRLWDSILAVRLEDVARAAGRLASTNRTVGWFVPTPGAAAPEISRTAEAEA